MFTLGADPEIFVKKDGKPFSAHGLLTGTKKEPLKTSVGAVQVDGMALEFNIDPVAQGDFERFNYEIVKTIKDMREIVADKDGKLSFVYEPVMEFGEEYLAQQPEEAKELGCDPDWCAYTMAPNPKPDGERPFRTGAGHIHIGWGADIPVDNEEHLEICASFIKMLDATLGMFMTVIDRDPRRRELYGKAGAFRPKPYGVEYRTPSNVWIKNRDRRMVVHALINRAIQYQTAGYSIQAVSGRTEETVQEIINNGDFVSAQTIVDTILYHSVCRAEWNAIKAAIAKQG